MLVQGKDGEESLDILDGVEQLGEQKFNKEDLEEIVRVCPEIYQYDRAITLALLIYTIGTAHGRVKFDVECGLDAWRKFYNRHVFLAEDMQHILIIEFIALKFVNENEVDGLFCRGGKDHRAACESW